MICVFNIYIFTCFLFYIYIFSYNREHWNGKSIMLPKIGLDFGVTSKCYKSNLEESHKTEKETTCVPPGQHHSAAGDYVLTITDPGTVMQMCVNSI